MSGYLPQEPQTFINIKLTDEGRKLLSLGQLTFATAVLSDREIKYNIDITNQYDISCSNRILAPKDAQPFINVNFDGSAPVPLATVGSLKQIITADTTTTGFFTGSTDNWGIYTPRSLGYSVISYSAYTPNGTNVVQMSGGTYFPKEGNLVYIPWQTIQGSGNSYSTSSLLLSASPSVSLFYRVISASTGTSSVYLDRSVPNFGSIEPSSTQAVNAYFYPFNGIETYYGSASSVDTRVWNLNVVRTSSEIGTNAGISGYTTYGSIEYNGTKQYLGFSSETRQIGIIHYTNNYSGNSYAEQLVEGTVEVDMPWIMWHRTAASAGQGTTYGLKLTDFAGPTYFDSLSQTTWRPLRDGNSTSSNILGMVYHKLKIMVITDPELLTALTFKSNRNYTLPSLAPLESTQTPKYPLDNSTATGLLETGYTYYVTYLVDSDRPYSSGSTYGYQAPLHCGYIQKIDGVLDINGDPQFLKVTFPTSSFPFMRNSSGLVSYSGSGWNANKIQLLVNKVSNTSYTYQGVDNIPTDTWRLMSTGVGNGILSGSPLDPLTVLGYTFVVSQEDYNSGSTYSLDGYYSAFTMNNNSLTESGLTFGDEYIFFGNVKTGIMATTFKTTMTVLAPNTSFNSTTNPTFNGTYNTDTYITEIGVLSQGGVLVATGKPTYPIAKNSSKYLAFQLEIDF
jgi:hypothetical protein